MLVQKTASAKESCICLNSNDVINHIQWVYKHNRIKVLRVADQGFVLISCNNLLMTITNIGNQMSHTYYKIWKLSSQNILNISEHKPSKRVNKFLINFILRQESEITTEMLFG